MIRLYVAIYIQNRTVSDTGAAFGTLNVTGEQTKAGLPDRVVELFMTFIQGSGAVGREILPVINRRSIISKCSSNDYCSGGSELKLNCPRSENCLLTCKRPMEREPL